MTAEIQDDTPQAKACTPEECSPCEKGTTTLLAGAGIGAYGVANYAAAGVVCPFCIIAAPALIGTGLFLRARYNRKEKDPEACQD